MGADDLPSPGPVAGASQKTGQKTHFITHGLAVMFRKIMRISPRWLAAPGLSVLLLAGCAGPERKLGRGINNMTEPARLGEWRRSVEQTALWESPEKAYTTGMIRGFDRTVARTAIGLYEVVTFPFPSYDPLYPTKYSSEPVYPDSYRPHLVEDSTFAPDTSLGYAGGNVIPLLPGSRFHVFDN